ncbi:hypothetical protein [Terricaulis sp.]|uniref:hypothetical protein n=1 Tax=Terricaulis sp. TaxID=2768686 RepID=UPI003784B65B
MIKRTLAAFVILATTQAWAQTTEPAPLTPPSETAAPAGDTPPPALEALVPALPTDPMELVAYALENARQPAQCRFVFNRVIATNARAGWSDSEADAIVRFDPRLPLGERWTVTQAARQQRAIQRAMSREDRKGFPSDLMMLTAEGEYFYDNVAFARELPDRYVYSFTPRVNRERTDSDTGIGIIEQLVGEVEVSRETGRVISSTLREPPEGAVRALGIVRVHRALVRNSFAPGANDLHLADSGSQMYQMSALLTQTEVTTTFRYTDIEPVCDPAEVARIQETEAGGVAARARLRN